MTGLKTRVPLPPQNPSSPHTSCPPLPPPLLPVLARLMPSVSGVRVTRVRVCVCVYRCVSVLGGGVYAPSLLVLPLLLLLLLLDTSSPFKLPPPLSLSFSFCLLITTRYVPPATCTGCEICQVWVGRLTNQLSSFRGDVGSCSLPSELCSLPRLTKHACFIFFLVHLLFVFPLPVTK